MSELVLSFRAPTADVKAVRLRTEAYKRNAPPEFRRRGRTRTWELRVPRPDGLVRLEYELEVERANGTTETLVDPENPLRASAPFGERSVLELDGYERPVWIDDDEAPAGTIEPFSIRSRLLRSDVGGFVWSANGVEPETLLPLLVVHDGPEYAEHSSLLRLFDSAVAELELKPFRAALVAPPGDRNETYSASTRYANALGSEVVPALHELAPTPDLPGARVGMGASLGALAAFHAHRVHRHLFGGLFLQSGSYFRRATDPQERSFPRFERISRFAGAVLRAESAPAPIPIVMTCGCTEENIGNNRALRDALVRQRYDVRLHEHPDLHNWVSWRDTFHPHLVALLERLWGMNRREVSIDGGTVLAYGHWGRPVLAFPSEQGQSWQYEERGMVEAIAPLIEDGRVKLFCVDSYDSESWQAQHLPLEERARRHGFYESWILERVVPWISADSGDSGELVATGVSFGAYHAANFALKRADLFPLAICQSGVYDVSVVGWGERGDSVYFNNPGAYVAHLNGDHLRWLRERVSLLLVCGSGQWEDTTGALESTQRFGALLGEKGIRCEVDVWGNEYPHDWSSWREQFAHHLPRFA